ncbi:DUF4405 domain-containing protein [Desulfovibrio aminophilus]|nr:DUF4405 domain-containing protein [Desulfovibrio aminophilus]MCM0754579.1 DUF4405 domain-containing protein [Desulfovibrio aminophilus]
MRRIVSLTALLSLVLVLLTSVVLYIEPPGRVAYWSGWRLMGLSKEQWGAVHINTGVLFLAALCLHVWYNWTPLVSYLKDKARNLRFFTREFNWAAGITLAFVLGTLLGLPPFSTITDGNAWFQDRAARLYGEPPYGHAELSTLKTFASRVGLDLDTSLARLRAAGVFVTGPEETLQAVAERQGVTPRKLYTIMRPEPAPAPAGVLPEAPPPGTGNRNLADICQEYGLNIKEAGQRLADAGIASRPDQSLKEIARAANKAPDDIWAILRGQ